MGDNELLVDLFASQKLAVLATQSGGQPHGCLVAFAYTTDLKNLMFATRRDTRKFQDIEKSPLVAMLVDNRSNGEEDFHEAMGTAHELGMYTSGHIPYAVGLEGVLVEGMDEIAHVEELLPEFIDFDRGRELTLPLTAL